MLCLEGIISEDPTQMPAIFLTFPNVRILKFDRGTLTSPRLEEPHGAHATHAFTSSHLEHLHIPCWMVPLFRTFTQLEWIEHVTELHFTPILHNCWHSMAALLLATGKTLKKLVIGLTTEDDPPLLEHFNPTAWRAALQKCQLLEHLSLYMNETHIVFFVEFFSHVRQSSIKTIEFIIDFYGDIEELCAGFQYFADVLKDKSRFPRIGRVQILVQDSVEADEIDASDLELLMTSTLWSLKDLGVDATVCHQLL